MTGRTASDGPSPVPTASGRPLLGARADVVRRALVWAYVAALAAYVAIRLLPLRPGTTELATQALLAFVAASAAIALVAAYVHSTGIERRFWGLGCAGAAFLLVGRLHDLVIATLTEVGAPAAGMWAGVFNVAAVLTLLVILLMFSRFRRASVAARMRYVIDMAAVTLVATGAIEALVIGPWFDRNAVASVGLRFVYSASPVIGCFASAGVVMVFIGTHADRWEPWERTLAASFAALAVSLVLAPAAYVDMVDAFAGGWLRALTDVVSMTGVSLGLSGAVLRHLGSGRTWQLRPLATLEPSYGLFPSAVLPSIEFLSLPLLGIAAAQAADPSVRMVRLVIVGAIALTIAVRTLLTVMDTDALTAGVVTDPLTGLYNHRHFQRLLDQEVAYAVRYGENVSLIELDLDDFTAFNASLGHAEGDRMLVALARAVERAVRTCDLVCRSGGDEIAIILPSTDQDTAGVIADRILAELRGVGAPNGRHVSASAGVASLPGHAGERAELVTCTDAALYWAKTHGKDRATCCDAEIAFAGRGEDRVRDLVQRADNATVRALAAAVDARDEETQDHSRNVARYAVAVAQELGLDERTTRLLEHAGLLHDVGKIGVPDAILRKSGPLTGSERARMEGHVVLGEAILASTTMREILPWVRHHHERWDGTGYPDGLSGEAIPLEARILALANAYDAMRSVRPYRAGMSRSAALQEIDLGLGTAFDPRVGEVFIDSIGRTYL